DFARRLAARGRPVWVRFVLVPELTDDTGLVASIAKFAAELGNVQRVEVLPFHQLGRFKCRSSGSTTRSPTQRPPRTNRLRRRARCSAPKGCKRIESEARYHGWASTGEPVSPGASGRTEHPAPIATRVMSGLPTP